MPKINTYAIDGTVTNNDKVIGTDVATGETRNYLVSDIVALAGGGGGVTDFTSEAGTFINVTANTAATGSVSIGTVDLSATGTPDATTFLRGDNTWSTISVGTFLDLTDTPTTYTGSGGFFAVVNSGETAIEFTENPAAGYIDIGYIAFDLGISPEPSDVGNMWWSSDFETPYIQLDDGFKMRVGQDHVVRCRAGVNILTGDVVKFVDATGDTPIVGLADGSSDEPHTLVGVAVEDIPSGEFGFAMQFGGIKMDTALPGWTLGQLLYVDPLNPGKLTNSQPLPPNWNFPIAAVTRVGTGSSGRILVRAIPGLHLHDIIDIRLSGISDNDILQYDTGTGIWTNTPSGNITESTSSVLTITGGTNAVLGSGTTIEVGQATTSTSGYLSSTDWNTFNNKISSVVEDTTPQLGGTLDANTENITTVRKIDAAQFQAITNTLTVGTNINWNTANGTYAEVILSASGALQISNLGVGTPAVLKVRQDATTPGFNITAYGVSGGTVKWPGGSVPTITPAVNSIDIITFISDGTDIYASIVQDLQ
jgi:hypothetical protein